MIGLLQLLTVFIIVPFLTYQAIGFYVKVQMLLHNGFKLWGGLLDFHPMDLGNDITPSDLLDHIEDFIDDAK